MINNFITLLSGSVIVGGEAAPAAQGAATVEAASNAAGTAPAADSMLGGTNMIVMILIYVAVFAALYFFMIRPQRKKEKEMRELQQSIRTGDEVITSSGFYGKVTDVGEDCFVVEFGTNKGIRIPVRKSDVVAVKSPKLTQTTF